MLNMYRTQNITVVIKLIYRSSAGLKGQLAKIIPYQQSEFPTWHLIDTCYNSEFKKLLALKAGKPEILYAVWYSHETKLD